MSAHAFNPPSGMEAIVQCPRWALMNATFPDRSDPTPALEGEAAHWTAWELHARRPVDLGVPAPNGVAITDEILDSAEEMASALHDKDSLPPWQIEQTLRGPDAGFWGTPDALRAVMTGVRLLVQIKDFKHGHEVVDAWRNWQLLAYAVLWLQVHGVDGAGELQIDFEFEIVQPRAFHRGHALSTWRLSGGELRAYRNIMMAAMEASREPNPSAKVGPACEHCNGRHACAELQRVGVKASTHAGDGSPLDMTPQATGTELAFLKRGRAMLDARITGLEAEVEAHLRANHPVPGWMLAAGESREVWRVPEDQVVAMGPALNLTLGKLKALTPNQARKAGLDPAVVAALAHRPPSGMKLEQDDGSRAAKAFDARVSS